MFTVTNHYSNGILWVLLTSYYKLLYRLTDGAHQILVVPTLIKVSSCYWMC